MIALMIFGGVLLLLFLLLLAPVRLEVRFREEFSLNVKYLFLSFPILPGKEQAEANAEEAPAGEEPGQGLGAKLKSICQKEGFFGFLSALLEFLELLGTSSKRLLSHVRLKRFDLYLCLAGSGDAADAAVLYGEVSTAVYSACGFLFGLLPCRKKAVTVNLDYRSGENTVDFHGRASLCPLFALREAVVLLSKGMPFLKKIR